MTRLVPPRSPRRRGFGGEGGAGRMRFRLRRWDIAVGTVVATAWLVSLGPLPAILGLLVAKHVLVALLVAGIDAQDSRPARQRDP